MMAFTSAKSTLMRPGTVMMSLMPWQQQHTAQQEAYRTIWNIVQG